MAVPAGAIPGSRLGRVVPRILWYLLDRPHRFGAAAEYQRAVGQVLASKLRALERQDLVVRRVTPSSPPQVTYSLTDRAHAPQASVQGHGESRQSSVPGAPLREGACIGHLENAAFASWEDSEFKEAVEAHSGATGTCQTVVPENAMQGEGR